MFSEAVDAVITSSGKPNRLADVARFLNATIRECQVQSYFGKDLVEDQLTTSGNPYIYTRPKRLRFVRTVYYPSLAVYPAFIRPGRKMQSRMSDYYYYANSTDFIFAGLATGSDIDIAYYQYLPRLKYYTTTTRPAIYDYEAETWTYLDSNNAYVTTLGDTALEQTAQDNVGHWLLQDWPDLVTEGALAKIFKVVNDARAKASYALYKQQQYALTTSEVAETLDR